MRRGWWHRWNRRGRALQSVSDSLRSRVSESHPEQRQFDGHEARWGNVTVYFAHTVATRGPIHLGKAVKRLLDSELATAAAWPNEDAVRLSPKLAQIDRAAVDLRRVNQFLETHSGVFALGVLFRHPMSAIRLMRYSRAERDADSVSGLGQPSIAESQSQAPDGDRDTVAEIERLLVDRQKLLIMERSHESNLFGAEAGDEDAFVRLDLRGSYHTVVLDGLEQHLVMEPRLLLHRDGFIQLTVGVTLPSRSSTAAVVKGSHPDAGIFGTSDFPETYASADDEWLGGDWADELDGGQRMRVFTHAEPASIHQWFEVAVTRILTLIKAREGGKFLTYPIVIGQAGDCCDDWAHAHEDQIAQATFRAIPQSGEKLRMDVGPDFGISSGARIHATLASALVLHLRAWRPGIDDLNYTLLFERTVLLYMRMRALEQSLVEFAVAPRQVKRTYRTALELEREVRGGHIRAGTARDIATHVLDAMGTAAMLGVIGRGTSLLAERMATRASERAARTSNRFAAVGLFVAAIAAVPAVPSILQFIDDQRVANPDVTVWAVVQDLLTSPLQLSVVILAILAGIAVVGFATFVYRFVRALMSWRKAGWSSRVRGYEIVPVDLDDRQ